MMAGLDLEAGLAETLLDEARVRDHKEQSAVLPLLQYALLATWEQRSGRTLTLAGYDAAGRVDGAVAQAAERAWTRMLAAGMAEEQIRGVLRRLVRLGERAETTPRRMLLSDLASVGDLDDVRRMLDILAAAGLVMLDSDSAELVHEALLYAWPRLGCWIEEDHAALVAAQRLTDAARSWDQAGRKDEDLYRGIRLETALHAARFSPVSVLWRQKPGSVIDPLTRVFLARSKPARSPPPVLAPTEVRRKPTEVCRRLGGGTRVASLPRAADLGTCLGGIVGGRLRRDLDGNCLVRVSGRRMAGGVDYPALSARQVRPAEEAGTGVDARDSVRS